VGVVAFHLGLVAGGGRTGDRIQRTPSSLTVASSLLPPPMRQASSSERKLFPDTLQDLFVGSATVPREDFIKEYDIGVPWDEPTKGTKDILMLYGSDSSLPKSHADQGGGASSVYYLSALNATANCNSMKVILTKPSQENACLAVVAQWDSFHVHNFMRLKADDDKSDGAGLQTDYPLRYVSRRHDPSGKRPQFPLPHQMRIYWPMLIDYLQKLESTMTQLKPIAAEVAGDSNTIVVMVCNLGQAELLFNFVCSARARGLDLSHVLLFATDSNIGELAKSLGIAVFDVGDAFGEMPTKAAKAYGDRAFQAMMMSKVYCVHLINALGYDLLFQDVDVVWYRNPVEYFHSPDSGNFDFYFQDGTKAANIGYIPFDLVSCCNLTHSTAHCGLSLQMVRTRLDTLLTHQTLASTTCIITSVHGTSSTFSFEWVTLSSVSQKFRSKVPR
jgi:Nucleotide-diphospho-sugar transferase